MYCIAIPFRAMMNRSKSFCHSAYTMKSSNCFMTIMVIKVFNESLIYCEKGFIGLQCLRMPKHWVSQCQWCLVSKGDYNEPKTVQGNLVANQPLELLCIDFTKADVAKGGKENSCSHRCIFQVQPSFCNSKSKVSHCG